MQSRDMRPLALVSQTAHSEEPPTTSVGFGVYVQISMRCCRRVRGVETLQWETTSMTIGWRTGDRFQQSTGHKLHWGKKIQHVGRFLAETGVQCPARPAPCVFCAQSICTTCAAAARKHASTAADICTRLRNTSLAQRCLPQCCTGWEINKQYLYRRAEGERSGALSGCGDGKQKRALLRDAHDRRKEISQKTEPSAAGGKHQASASPGGKTSPSRVSLSAPTSRLVTGVKGASHVFSIRQQRNRGNHSVYRLLGLSALEKVT